MKKILLATGVALIALALGANTASAQTIEYASGVESYTAGTVNGGGSIPSPRDDASRALGAPNGEFVSLGYGGELIVSFDTLMSGPLVISVQEITGGSSYPEELARVWVSPDNVTWTDVGLASNELAQGDGLTTFDLGERCVKYVRIVDETDSSIHGNGTDGFDVDAVIGEYDRECKPEPEPEPRKIHVRNSNEGFVMNIVSSGANSGGNTAGGSYAGNGGRGGNIDNVALGSVDDSTTGYGGRGGNSAAGGYVESGAARSNASAVTLVNSNTTRIQGCDCDGDIRVRSRNSGAAMSMVGARSNSGLNRAGGSEAGRGGRGGDILNGDPITTRSEGDQEDNVTGRGGRGGDSGPGGAIFSGPAVSEAMSMTALNRNETRISHTRILR